MKREILKRLFLNPSTSSQMISNVTNNGGENEKTQFKKNNNKIQNSNRAIF